MPHDRFPTVAARCARVFYEDHKRSPYVYQRRMNTDPNVHISVEAETVPFERVISKYLIPSCPPQALGRPHVDDHDGDS